jgi:hypothetical protein
MRRVLVNIKLRHLSIRTRLLPVVAAILPTIGLCVWLIARQRELARDTPVRISECTP